MNGQRIEELRIALVDDHELMRQGLKRSLESTTDLLVVGEASDGSEAVDLAERTKPDVILMDISMPHVDGVEAARRVKAAMPHVKVVMLSMLDDVDVVRAALDAGASGFLTKGMRSHETIEFLRMVGAGEMVMSPRIADALLSQAGEAEASGEVSMQCLLSDRHVQILQMTADGMTPKQIAVDLEISVKTVHNQLSTAYKRLDAVNMAHAVVLAFQKGLIDLTDSGSL